MEGTLPDRFKITVLALFLILRSVGLIREDSQNTERLKVTIIDVGQGDAILVEYNDIAMLVDGGGDYTAAAFLSKKYFLNRCNIDLVFLTHPHADHLSGLNRVISWCDVGKFIYYGQPVSTTEYRKMNYILSEKKIGIQTFMAGDIVNIEDLKIHVLWPDQSYLQEKHQNVNLYSYVLLIEIDGKEIILTGDAEKEILERLVSDQQISLIEGPVELLKVAHHGSKYSLSENFYQRIRPLNCVISVGENRYGHPDETIIQYLNVTGCKVFRTDNDGSVVFIL
jgi:competence protein ComEC